MELKLTDKEFRRLLDMAYIGNWVLNAARGDDRFKDYDIVESKLFDLAHKEDFPMLTDYHNGVAMPSRAFMEGGIHEAIIDYENNVFFDILAEDLARRDMFDVPISEENFPELSQRIAKYMAEFERHGTDNIMVEIE